MWTAAFGGRQVISVPAVTTIAGAAMSLQAESFLDRDSYGKIRPDELEIIYNGGKQPVHLKVSSRPIDEFLVSTVDGNPAMGHQPVLVSKAAVDSISAIFMLRNQ